jgi:hypothetical protein
MTRALRLIFVDWFYTCVRKCRRTEFNGGLHVLSDQVVEVQEELGLTLPQKMLPFELAIGSAPRQLRSRTAKRTVQIVEITSRWLDHINRHLGVFNCHI